MSNTKKCFVNQKSSNAGPIPRNNFGTRNTLVLTVIIHFSNSQVKNIVLRL